MERRILDSLQEEDGPSSNQLKPGLGSGLSRLGRQPSAVHIGFSKPPSGSSHLPNDDTEEEPQRRSLTTMLDPPVRHASTLEAVTPISIAVDAIEGDVKKPDSPKRRKSAIWMDEEQDPYRVAVDGGDDQIQPEIIPASRQRRGSVGRRSSLKSLDGQAPGSVEAPALTRRRSSIKAPMETPKEETTETFPPPMRRKSSVKPLPAPAPEPKDHPDEEAQPEPPKLTPPYRPLSSSLASRAITPMRRHRTSSASAREGITEGIIEHPSEAPEDDVKELSSGMNPLQPQYPNRIRSPARRSSLVSGLPATPESITADAASTDPAPTIMQQSAFGQRLLTGHGLAQIQDGVTLEIARPVATDAARGYDHSAISRRIVRKAFPNPEVLAHARMLARNPNADVRAMVAAYDPYPLIWPGPGVVLEERTNKGRPLEDQWKHNGAPRFGGSKQASASDNSLTTLICGIELQTDLGPGTYQPQRAYGHTPNAANIVFKKGAPRFMKTALDAATTANVAPGSYELRDVKVAKGYTPWVVDIGSILARSAAERPKVLMGSDMGLIETIGNMKVPSFKGSHQVGETAKSESDTSSRRKNLKITAMHPFSKCYLMPSPQSASPTLQLQQGTSIPTMGAPSIPISLSPPLVSQPRRSVMRAVEE
ncbi:hypothetical protein HDU67_008659 [Dinochytrium kinnereticum]|nr:hypothetical protein HDU67_008659 [Dinochytrium kinnereticum]